MKNFIFKATLSLMILFSIMSCEKKDMNDVITNEPVTEIQRANVELQRAADIIVSMVAENANYFSYIDAALNDKSLEYMEDRVLFRDLFSSDVETDRDVIAPKSMGGLSFADDFARLAEDDSSLIKACIDKKQTDVQSLMDYLVDNNISIYCPFPLDMYEEDNRIPAIATVVNEGEIAMPGIQYHADGTYEDVMVDQAYADEHPVWIIRQEDDYIFDASNSRNKTLSAGSIGGSITIPDTPAFPGRIYHYEMSIGQIYCTEYMGPLADGDLDIRLCFCESNPTYSTADECFYGTFDRMISVKMPRKYVMHAKEGRFRGWFTVDCVFVGDWKTNEYEKYFAAYEYDPKKEYEQTHDFRTTFTLGAQIKNVNLQVGEEYGASISLKYRSKDDLMGLMKWDRVWVKDILKNGGATWRYYDGTVKKTDCDGNYLIKPASYLWVSIKERKYYSDSVKPIVE